MNGGTLNGYAINARGARGGAIRVAADLLGQAYISAKARVLRHLTGPIAAKAEIGSVVGWRGVRSPVQVVGQAVSAVISVPRMRDEFDAACQAVVTAAARAGRRALVAFEATAQIDLGAYALLRGAAQFRGRAMVPAGLKSWRFSPEAVTASATVVLRAGVLNEFPYDEDAPEERVFLVVPEDNAFYVVV